MENKGGRLATTKEGGSRQPSKVADVATTTYGQREGEFHNRRRINVDGCQQTVRPLLVINTR